MNNPVTPQAAWLPLLQVLQLEEGVMACGHLSCPLEQLAVTPVHLLPIAQHLCTSQVPSIMEPGSQGTSFPLEFLKGMWEMGQGQLNVAEFPEKLLES